MSMEKLQEKSVVLRNISQNIAYEQALSFQEQAVSDVLDGQAQRLFFVEHSSVFTCGTSADIEKEVLSEGDIPVIQTGRGGKITYHGPGQRVVYPIMDLRERERDLRKYITDLQNWLIDSLSEFDVQAYTTDDIGVWVDTPSGTAKIAAIGVRVRKWVSFHGIALNVSPNLSHYQHIIPCGIDGKGVTSLQALGINKSMKDVDQILLRNFEKAFNCKIVKEEG